MIWAICVQGETQPVLAHSCCDSHVGRGGGMGSPWDAVILDIRVRVQLTPGPFQLRSPQGGLTLAVAGPPSRDSHLVSIQAYGCLPYSQRCLRRSHFKSEFSRRRRDNKLFSSRSPLPENPDNLRNQGWPKLHLQHSFISSFNLSTN